MYSKNMKLYSNLIKLATLKRFQLSVFFSFLLFLLFVAYLGNIYKISCLDKYASILFCSELYFLSCNLYLENSNLLHKDRLCFYTVIIYFIFLYYLYRIHFSIYVYIFLILGLSVLLFISPFLSKEVKSEELFNFQYHLVFQMVLVSIITVALIAIAAFIIFSLKKLFDINFEPALKYIVAFILSFLSHIMLMSQIPTQQISEIGDHKVLVFVLDYIIIPFLLIYSVILHSYAFKIFFLHSLPRGTIVYLVCIFNLVGIVTYFITFPFRDKNNLFSFFKKNFFKIIFVPTFLLAISIGVRINSYGITPNRYIVSLLLCWFLLSICFSFLFKNGKLLKYIIVSISALLIFASLPIVGAIDVSKWSQARLAKDAAIVLLN